VPRGLVASLRDDPADLFCYFAGLAVVQFEISRHLHRQREGGRAFILVDRYAQDARLDVCRLRVEIIGRRQAPALLPRVERPVVAEVVVGVGNQANSTSFSVVSGAKPNGNGRQVSAAALCEAVIFFRAPKLAMSGSGSSKSSPQKMRRGISER
jgi:hypothetical protein